MFKWHINSAIGRSRPATHDISRVVDGIAASLRQFSISAARCEEGDREDALRKTRSARSELVSRELSSLRPSRGIDARSLAAKPPGGFTIRRYDESSGQRPTGGPAFSSSYRGRSNSRGGGPRTGARGARGARGAGRGARGGRGAARGRGGKRERQAKPKMEDEGEPVPYTAEELEYIDNSKGGFQKPYTPVTSTQDLARWGPPVISSPRGVVETLAYKMAVATDNQTPDYKIGGHHQVRINQGVGTLYENAGQRQKSKKAFGRSETLSKQDQESMMKQWAAGRYVAPQPVQEAGDALAQVAAYTRRNETYLPADAKKFEDKLRSLLPATITKPPPTAARPLM